MRPALSGLQLLMGLGSGSISCMLPQGTYMSADCHILQNTWTDAAYRSRLWHHQLAVPGNGKSMAVVIKPVPFEQPIMQ